MGKRRLNAWQKRRQASGWSGGYIEWTEGRTAFLSVVFSWLLPKALERARYHGFMGYDVRVGGPAVDLNPGYFGGFAKEGGSIPGVLQRHNQKATRATKGCIRRCPFCAVWRTEGKLQELSDDLWPVLPLECSNNLLAASNAFFDHVIDRYLESDVQGIDFNQGLDARKLTEHHAGRLVELHRAKKLKQVRLAWDNIETETEFRGAHKRLRDAGMPKGMISVYVLIGFEDTPEDALYRLSEVWALGAWPNPMRYQPLDAERRNEFIGERWTDSELKRYCKYWSNLRHLSGVPFDEYRI
jgi:hypothetical protein